MTTLKKAVTRRVDADHGRVPIAITISIMYAYRLAVQSDKREN